MRLPISVILAAWLQFTFSAMSWAATVQTGDKCLRTEEMVQLAAGTRVSLSSDTARVNQPMTLSLRTPKISIKPNQPIYFVALLPEEVRLAGTGFFGLAPGAPGPSGMAYGRDRLRAIVPLHGRGRPSSVDLKVIPYRAGVMKIEWSVVALGPCGEELMPATAGQGTAAVLPGIPELAPRDEFATAAPLTEVKALKREFRARAYPDYVEVFDDRTGEMLMRVPGTDPEFSPTGRFLIITTSELEYYDVFDLVAIRKVGHFHGFGLYWSHADSFLYLDQPMEGNLTIVRALHGARYAPLQPALANVGELLKNDGKPSADEEDIVAEPGAGSFVSGSAAWALELSIDAGIVALSNTWVENMEREMNRNQHIPIEPDRDNDKTRVRDFAKEITEAGFVLDLTRLAADRRVDKTQLPALLRKRYGLLKPKIVGWNVHGDLDQAASAGGPENMAGSPISTVHLKTQTQKKASALTRIDGDRQGVRRSVVPLGDEQAFAETSRIAGVELALFPARSPKLLRVGKSKNEIKSVAAELKTLLPAQIVTFGPDPQPGYLTSPFPDPAVKPQEVPVFDFDAPGRDLWAFETSSGRHWLTETVEAGRVGIDYQFTLLSKAKSHKLRYANLLKQANDYAGKLTGDASPEAFSLTNYGDFRTELDKAFGAPAAISIAGGRYLMIATKPIPRLIAFDLDAWKVLCAIPAPVNADDIRDVALTKDQSHIVQINGNGQIEVYSCADTTHLMSGLYIDGELVMIDESGHFEGSDDAAEYVELKIPGLPGRHLLSQFTKTLRREGLTNAVLAGTKIEAAPALEPPSIIIRSAQGEGAFLVSASSTRGLKSIAAFSDGRPSAHYDVDGKTAEIVVKSSELGKGGIVTLIASDVSGMTSAPVELMTPKPKSGPSGKLFAVTVGVDLYHRMPGAELNYSAADARRIAKLAKAATLYRGQDVKTLTDAEATSAAIISALQAAVRQGGPDDTILVSFAGHGLVAGDQSLRMALTETDLGDLSRTSLALDDVLSVLKRSKARVVLFLDVCHSGLANQSRVATNDAAAAKMLTTESGAGIVIMSASKGRQFSEETASLGGGRFSTAIESILEKKRRLADTDGNGHISIQELYRAVKAEVMAGSETRQTPWIARNQVFGDFDLF